MAIVEENTLSLKKFIIVKLLPKNIKISLPKGIWE